MQLLLLFIAMGVAGFARTALSSLQEAMRAGLHLSDNQMALLQGPVIGIPVVLAAIPLGFLIDRRPRNRLVLALALASLAGSLLTALAPSLLILFIARAVVGITALAIIPVVFSLLADLYPPASRGRATTFVIIGQVAGNSLAFALGGVLLERHGLSANGWRGALLELLIPYAAMVLALLAIREPTRHGRASIAAPTLGQVWHEVRDHRSVMVPIVMGIVLMEVNVGAMLIWGAPMLSRQFGLTADRVGSIMATGSLVSGVVGPLAGGLLADACQRLGGPRRTVSVLGALAALSAPLGVFAFVPDPRAASVLLIVMMTVTLAVAVMGITFFTLVIPNEVRGFCLSLLMAGDMLCSFAVAPVVVSVLSQSMGGLAMIGRSLSLVCIAANLLAAMTFVLGRRPVARAIVY